MGIPPRDHVLPVEYWEAANPNYGKLRIFVQSPDPGFNSPERKKAFATSGL
jgi:hypothetical protein